MRKIFKNIFLFLLLSVFVFQAEAQKIYNGQIVVNPRELSQKGDSLVVNIDIDLTGLVMEDDRALSLIPLLVSPDTRLELPNLLINGRRRHKVYDRELAFSKKHDNKETYAVIKAEKKANKTINYRLALPFEGWMEKARLDLKEDLYGCAGQTRQIAIDKLVATVLMEGKSRYDVTPLLSYIRPEVEEVKKRSEQHEAFLDFPVAKTEINPSYMNNPRELEKIESMLNEIRKDKNLTVNGVSIRGYASPEGSVALNNRLSGGRAEALRYYLSSKSTLPVSVYNVEHGGEDWSGLEKLIEASSMLYKSEVLAVIRSGKPEDARERDLRKIASGGAFAELMKNYFPQLRRVQYRVDYTVRGFNVDEAKEIFKKSPKLLSLEELFMVANTYEMDERGFADVFETAVRMYPDDKVANLNAAASALQWGDTEQAKKYLDKSSGNSKEYTNNLGVYHLLIGEYNKARDLFDQAIKKGVTNAEHNLKELDRKIEVEGL